MLWRRTPSGAPPLAPPRTSGSAHGLSLRRAPLGFARFKEMVDSDFYKGVRFFRVIDGFMAQFVRSLLPAPEDVH